MMQGMERDMTPRPFKSGNHLLDALDDENYTRIAGELRWYVFSRGEMLQERDKPLRHVYFPVRSVVWLTSETSDGATAQIAMVGGEGVVDSGASVGSSVALCDASVHMAGENAAWGMTVDLFRRELDSDGSFTHSVRTYAARVVEGLARSVACNAYHTAEQRCCRWLLEAADRIGRDELAVTHRFIGDLLGLRRPTVSIMMERLHTDGVVTSRRRQIRITDRAALEARACECYHTMQPRGAEGDSEVHAFAVDGPAAG
jgi:CRP-like cAMP-binding protein